MSEELKPCPFCGSKGTPSKASFGPVNAMSVLEFHDVTCDNCFAIVPGHSRSKAITKWNQRTETQTQTKLDAAVEHLQWIAQQTCTQDAPNATDDMDCTQVMACVTEYCLSCYAKTVLKEIKK